MKLEKLLQFDVLTGIVLGLLIGLRYSFASYELPLVIAAVVMGLKVVSAKK